MVLVSHSHQFVFLKTRKTAGTSVEMYLEPFCTGTDTPVPERRNAKVGAQGIVGSRMVAQSSGDHRRLDGVWFNHMPARNVRARIGSRIWDRYLKIATLRNPFERAVSQYYFMVARGGAARSADLGQVRNQFRDHVSSDRFDDDAEIVFIRDRLVVDHFLRFEHLEDDLADLSEKLELDPSKTRLPLTKQTRPDWIADVPDHYDPKTIQTVREKCAWMFKQGDYPDEPVSSRRAGSDSAIDEPMGTLPDRACQHDDPGILGKVGK